MLDDLAFHIPIFPGEMIGMIKNLCSKTTLGLDENSDPVLKYCIFIRRSPLGANRQTRHHMHM